MTDTLEALRQRLQQLRALRADGTLDEERFAPAAADLERQIVERVLAAPQAAAAAASATSAASSDPTASSPPRASGRLWGAVGLVALLLAAAGYWSTGSPERIGEPPPGFEAQAGGDAAAPAEGASAPHAMDSAQFAAMTERLAERLKAQPDDPVGWSMLGRSYMALGRFDDGLAAFERAASLRPNDAGALADLADALAVKNGRELDGEPLKLVERALKIDPNNLKALTLAGTAAFNRGDYAKAAAFWDRAVKVGPPDSPIVQQARNAADEARQLGKLPSAVAGAASTPAAGQAATPAPAAGEGTITGTVTLAPALRGKVSPDDAVFIFARPAAGSRMPLAIVRKQVRDLPFAFRLDDTQAMSPAARISQAGQVIVGARVSKSGQAMPQPGDLEGLSPPVAVGTSGLAVEIGSEVR